MTDLNERVTALESIFSKVNLDGWSNDQDVPLFLAWRIRALLDSLRFGPSPEPWSLGHPVPWHAELHASLISAVHLTAQAKLAQGTQGEGLARLTSEIIDDWCGTRVPGRFPPRPHWGAIVAQLGGLAERYPAGSVLREAAFDLGRRVVDRARELSEYAK